MIWAEPSDEMCPMSPAHTMTRDEAKLANAAATVESASEVGHSMIVNMYRKATSKAVMLVATVAASEAAAAESAPMPTTCAAMKDCVEFPTAVRALVTSV